MTSSESRVFEAQYFECVLYGLCIERWERSAEDTLNTTRRWCVVGWQAPDIHEIERSSPMPTDTAINVAALGAQAKTKSTAVAFFGIE